MHEQFIIERVSKLIKLLIPFDPKRKILNCRYAEYKVNDYHLDTLIEENQYFIVSPKDIVVATLYENDDRVKWLIEHE